MASPNPHHSVPSANVEPLDQRTGVRPGYRWGGLDPICLLCALELRRLGQWVGVITRSRRAAEVCRRCELVCTRALLPVPWDRRP
jgi:hypothetical protein